MRAKGLGHKETIICNNAPPNNLYWLLFFQALHFHALETDLRKCTLVIVLGFAKGSSQPVFVGHCFQTYSGSREQILFLISPSVAFPCVGNRSPKMRPGNSVEFCKRAQSASFRRPLFSNTFWVQRTDLVPYFPCFGSPSPKMHPVNSVTFCERAQSSNFRRSLFSNTF
jgi:hypothetical protein